MTRKDYILIAQALKDACVDIQCKEPEEAIPAGVGYAADWLADALQADNPRFDRARFLAACGVTR